MYLQCYTDEEIAQSVGIDRTSDTRETQFLCEMEATSKMHKTANF